MKYINLEYHPCDSRIRVVDNDICQTLNTRMGTGGGNVPLILAIHEASEQQVTFQEEIAYCLPSTAGGVADGTNLSMYIDLR